MGGMALAFVWHRGCQQQQRGAGSETGAHQHPALPPASTAALLATFARVHGTFAFVCAVGAGTRPWLRSTRSAAHHFEYLQPPHIQQNDGNGKFPLDKCAKQTHSKYLERLGLEPDYGHSGGSGSGSSVVSLYDGTSVVFESSPSWVLTLLRMLVRPGEGD